MMQVYNTKGTYFGDVIDINHSTDEVVIVVPDGRHLVVSATSLIPTEKPGGFLLAYDIDTSPEEAVDPELAPHQRPAGIDKVLEERGSNYGSFEDNAESTQIFKAVLRASPSWEGMTPAQQEALEMIVHKISRIINGDPNYDDSWRDISGYAQLVVNSLVTK